jgi:hypothetical protein
LARDEQTGTRRWNRAALLCVIAAAIFGAATAAAPGAWTAWVAGAATIASAVGGFLGRQIVGSGDEADWIQARAVAEGLKSECFRYAARAGAYAAGDADALKTLAARTREIEKQATDKRLVRGDDPVPESGDKREPPVPLTADWYRTGRIEDQIEYYRERRADNQKAADRIWWVAFASGLAAVVLGALGAIVAPSFAPWIGATTTIAAAIVAYGLLERRKYLVASYAAMQSSLEQIIALDKEIPMSLADLVTATEDLLNGEHKAWLPQMLSTQHAAPSEAPKPLPARQ